MVSHKKAKCKIKNEIRLKRDAVSTAIAIEIRFYTDQASK